MEQTLFSLADVANFADLSSRIATLTRVQAIEELVYQHEEDDTVLSRLMGTDDVPLDLLKSITAVMKGDERKRNLFTVSNSFKVLPLHICANWSNNLQVLQYTIDQYPPALLAETIGDETPLDYAKDNKNRANYSAIVLCLEENMRKLPTLMNQFAVKCSMAALKTRGMYALVSALPLNDLSPMQFVYLVLDEMVNRQMKQLAEDILAYVGTNVGLPTYTKVKRVKK